MYTTDNYNKYKEMVQSRKGEEIEYIEKEYPIGFTIPDKKIVDGRKANRTYKITGKIFMLFVCIIILTLIFSRINKDNKSFTTIFLISIIGFMVTIPLFYTMKVSYYEYLIYFTTIVIFGTMGYGWGLFNVLINLNPTKKKPLKNNKLQISEKKISGASP